MLDVEVVKGVGLPYRKKSKKVRYDDECNVAIFELVMSFENSKEFIRLRQNMLLKNIIRLNEVLMKLI